MIDYLGYLALKVLGPFFRILPPECSLFIGRRLGDLVCCLDRRHRSQAYAHLKRAFGADLSPAELRLVVRKFYRSFGQNFIEMFLIPRVDASYIKKYVEIQGMENIRSAFAKGKGALMVGVHAGSWELSNVISANLEFPFYVLVRDQRYPRLASLLNHYRRQKGCRLIQRQEETRQLIRLLKDNASVGLTVDQGGKAGTRVEFLGQEASMASGAVRLALKYGAAILPCYYVRKSGPHIKVIVSPEFKILPNPNKEEEVRENLQRLVAIFEGYIREYPQEYLWTYKIWKYSRKRRILILGDGRTGHLRQSQAVAGIVRECFAEKGIDAAVETVETPVTGRAGLLLTLSARFGGGSDRLFALMPPDRYKMLAGSRPDVIISCGTGVAAVNRILSREFKSRSIVVMQPALLGIKGFDLALIPEHDHPVKAANVVATDGALNLVSPGYLDEQSGKLKDEIGGDPGPAIGLLIGGDTKAFRIDPGLIGAAFAGLRSAAEALGANILVTTSRRTSGEVVDLVRKTFFGYPRCKYLVIASEKNPAHALGGILGLSQLVVTTPESISMISEAVTSRRHCVAIDLPGLGRKHREFLRLFHDRGYLRLSKPGEIEDTIRGLWDSRPQVVLADRLRVKEAVMKIL